MGNITSKPKAPAPQVVYVPQPVYTTVPDTPSTGSDDKQPTAAEQRENNLLARNRSRLGTILTSFRGILAPVETDGQKKTLLGE